MPKLNIVVADYDLSYLDALCSFLNTNYTDKLFTSVVSDTKYLNSHLRGKKTDILLINPDFYDEDLLKGYNIVSIIFLSEHTGAEGLPYAVVNKFQQGETLYEEVMDIYMKQNLSSLGSITREYNNTKVLSFYSPIGGIGKSSLAVLTALEIGKAGQEVLYLNLEDIQSTPMFFSCDANKSFSDFLYLIKVRNSSVIEKLPELKNRINEYKLDYFSPADSAMDIEELSAEDIQYLLESLLKLNFYSYIIVDLTSKYNNQYKSILEVSKNVVMPIGQDALARLKCEQFFKQVYSLNKYYFVLNKFKARDKIYIKDLLEKNSIEGIQKIDYDHSLTNVESGEDIKASPSLNRAVKDIINNLGLLE